MKISKYILGLFAGSLLFGACNKDVVEPFDVTYNTSEQAYVKIIHASPYRNNPVVQLKLNDSRVSGNITYSTPFPGGGLNTGGSNFPYYLPVNPGSNKIALSIQKQGTGIDSIQLYATNLNLQAGKYYSVFLADTSLNTASVILEDDMTPVTGDVSKSRFVNLIPNLAAVDLYFGTTLVAGNIPYKGASATFTLPRAAVNQWRIRPAGAAPTSTAIAIYPSGTTNMTIPFNKYMTVYARGYNGVTGTETRVPAISLTYHQ